MWMFSQYINHRGGDFQQLLASEASLPASPFSSIISSSSSSARLFHPPFSGRTMATEVLNHLRTLLVVLLLLVSCVFGDAVKRADAERKAEKGSNTISSKRRVKRPPKQCRFPAIYNFGDSNSDTGGISAVFYPITMPYGQTYYGKAVGRASDGRLMVDFFAEHLGLPHLSAYLNSVGANYHHGANFATGSATIRMPNKPFLQGGRSPFNLQIQVAQIMQFKERVLDPGTESSARLPKPETFPKGLYMIDIGQNDLADLLKDMDFTMDYKMAIPAIRILIGQLAYQIQNLHFQGGRAFWVHNTGPIGCLPYTLTWVHKPPPPGYLDEHGCIKEQNELAKEFNRQLKDEIMSLRQNLSDATIIYVDVYAAKYGLISDAKNQGFGPPAEICCGYYKSDIRVTCGNWQKINGTDIYGPPCANPSSLISWDGVHYTEAANNWLATRILYGTFSDPPIPMTQACHRQQKT
uniref:Uncharacterized protein n=1 Tax=Kalanchoe fedtschenkoi TaxID=63787 RepID=A0A7N0TP91_KALFE